MKKSRHNVSFRDGRTHDLVIEELERHVESIVQHYTDPDVEPKASTITLKIAIKPGSDTTVMAVGVSSSLTLAPRRAGMSFIFGNVKEGVITVTEEDPRNQRAFELEGS